MIGIVRYLLPLRTGLAVCGIIGVTMVSASAASNGYPPGWNIAAQPAQPATYVFVAGGNRLHVVGRGSATAASAPADPSGILYTFVAGGNRMHAVQ